LEKLNKEMTMESELTQLQQHQHYTGMPELAHEWVPGMLEAARFGDVEEVQEWVAAYGLDVARDVLRVHVQLCLNADGQAVADESQQSSSSMLHMAAANGHTNIVEWLAPSVRTMSLAGNNPTWACNHQGSSPLHWATVNGHMSVVQLLLSLGANPAQRDGRGQSALTIAELAGNLDLASILLTAMSEEDVVDRVEAEAAAQGIDVAKMCLNVERVAESLNEAETVDTSVAH
jgi:uncharacterized protein